MVGSSPSVELALTASLDRLFRGHHAWLSALLRKRYGIAVAEDLAHETYLRAAPYEMTGRMDRPKALLLRIADNLARNQARRVREVDLGDAVEVLEGAVEAPVQEQAVLLRQIVLALPPKLRDVFVLNHIEGLTYSEIARLKGLPLTTVHHRMRKALERVSAAMRD